MVMGFSLTTKCDGSNPVVSVLKRGQCVGYRERSREKEKPFGAVVSPIIAPRVKLNRNLTQTDEAFV